MAWVNAPVSRQAWCSGLLLAEHIDLSLVDLTDLSLADRSSLTSFWMTFTVLFIGWHPLTSLWMIPRWPRLNDLHWHHWLIYLPLFGRFFSGFWLTDLLSGWLHWAHLSLADFLLPLVEWPSLTSKLLNFYLLFCCWSSLTSGCMSFTDVALAHLTFLIFNDRPTDLSWPVIAWPSLFSHWLTFSDFSLAVLLWYLIGWPSLTSHWHSVTSHWLAFSGLLLVGIFRWRPSLYWKMKSPTQTSFLETMVFLRQVLFYHWKTNMKNDVSKTKMQLPIFRTFCANFRGTTSLTTA